MHSPGVCGVILAGGSQLGAGAELKAEAVGKLIDALSAGTEMVLVGVAVADAEALAPVVWARAAYLVPLPNAASDADALRAMLQEVLNRGRDAAIVTVPVVETEESAPLRSAAPTAEMVQRMVAEFCAAGDEIWAVVPEVESVQGHPVLMGRRMIELFLRGQKWSAADEIVSAHLEHVRTFKLSAPLSAGPAAMPSGWKAPWDL